MVSVKRRGTIAYVASNVSCPVVHAIVCLSTVEDCMAEPIALVAGKAKDCNLTCRTYGSADYLGGKRSQLSR